MSDKRAVDAAIKRMYRVDFDLEDGYISSRYVYAVSPRDAKDQVRSDKFPRWRNIRISNADDSGQAVDPNHDNAAGRPAPAATITVSASLLASLLKAVAAATEHDTVQLSIYDETQPLLLRGESTKRKLAVEAALMPISIR